MTDTVRVRLSTGLFALALFHVLALGVACYVAHQRDARSTDAIAPARPWTPPAYNPHLSRPLGDGTSCESLPEVNLHAQGELKQSAPSGEMKEAGPCLPCNRNANWSAANPFNLAPGETLLSVGPSRTVSQPAVQSPPSYLPPIPAAGHTMTIPAIGSPDASQRPPAKPVQILLFLDQSEGSAELQKWFQSDPGLAKLRAGSDFQVYTATSPLYRTRYARLVPADQFPVCLVQDASGGHIHAAGKQMIPRSGSQLHADIVAAYGLYKQAKQGSIQQTGALRTAGYSWDDQINPAMRLEATDCVGPLCPSPGFGPNPGGPNEGLFRPSKPADPISALLWGSSTDLATIFVFVLAGGLLIFILARRN
jgi:hypothetical protein